MVLFGHSGGGTLATLLATRLPATRALVTIAPNLNVSAWTALHRYTPLNGSLDPAQTREFPQGIFQVHWLGSADKNIPPNLLLALELEPDVSEGGLRVREGFDHTCCWSEIWPTQLAEIDAYFATTRKAGIDAVR